ncbi:eya-1 [Pristionchus pacificus]|uniref:Eyes absent homolog n=1 Tax=Pristionchus pacificus TaxID=54126 RepID=A0A2A6BN43_PRIPA|nr:eya-1 [Pristionchus pacificus]|eukprot:PDM67334.1 eya-1 [Pristionchus pacificus]
MVPRPPSREHAKRGVRALLEYTQDPQAEITNRLAQPTLFLAGTLAPQNNFDDPSLLASSSWPLLTAAGCSSTTSGLLQTTSPSNNNPSTRKGERNQSSVILNKSPGCHYAIRYSAMYSANAAPAAAAAYYQQMASSGALRNPSTAAAASLQYALGSTAAAAASAPYYGSLLSSSAAATNYDYTAAYGANYYGGFKSYPYGLNSAYQSLSSTLDASALSSFAPKGDGKKFTTSIVHDISGPGKSFTKFTEAPKNPRPKGWALRSTKKTGRYDPVARKLVDDLFEQYFSNGKTLRPDEAEKRMRERNDILPAQRMTFDQIRNRITTLLSQKKEHQRKEHGNRQRRYVKLIDDFERDLAEEGISLDDIEEEVDLERPLDEDDLIITSDEIYDLVHSNMEFFDNPSFLILANSNTKSSKKKKVGGSASPPEAQYVRVFVWDLDDVSVMAPSQLEMAQRLAPAASQPHVLRQAAHQVSLLAFPSSTDNHLDINDHEFFQVCNADDAVVEEPSAAAAAPATATPAAGGAEGGEEGSAVTSTTTTRSVTSEAARRVAAKYAHLRQVYGEYAVNRGNLLDLCRPAASKDFEESLATVDAMLGGRTQNVLRCLEIVTARSNQSMDKYANVIISNESVVAQAAQMLLIGAAPYVPLENLFSCGKQGKEMILERLAARFGKKCTFVVVSSSGETQSIARKEQMAAWPVTSADSFHALYAAQSDYLLGSGR